MQDGSFQVRVEGVRFDAAHFATFRGKCEPLHGHSYEVVAEVEGALTRDAWVVDFVRLKRLLRRLSKELDHRFMLQNASKVLQIEATEGNWKVKTPAGIGYVFPRGDVVALPVDNTTAERLSQWFSERVWQELRQQNRDQGVKRVSIEVWEGPGQRAAFRSERLPLH